MFAMINDGDYYAVRFDDGSYFKGRGLYFSDKQTTNEIAEATLYRFDWQIMRDIYLQQFLHGKDLKCEYVKVKVKTSIDIVPKLDEILCSNCGGKEVEEEGDICENCG